MSIAPYQFLTERIAGKDFTVQAVVPAVSNPHVYEPTAKQVAFLRQSAVWFQIGEPFEPKVLSVLKSSNPSLVAIDLREGIVLLDEPALACSECSMDHHDRHIWLSPKRTALQAGKIAAALATQFPEHREQFLENAKQLEGELGALDREIGALLDPVKDRVLLVSHPAFGYFCSDYNFEQLSVEFEGKDPRPRHLEAVMHQAIAHRAELALALPQHNNKGAQIIADKLHVPVRMVDPYSPDYFETMRRLAHIIANPEYQP